MEKKVLIKKKEIGFKLEDIEEITRVDIIESGIEITFKLK